MRYLNFAANHVVNINAFLLFQKSYPPNVFALCSYFLKHFFI
ncbi:hypothetical protein MSHv_07110 [Mycoplasmopsis synoviae]|nr:hypothetical protein MSHv_07110 [Mycoplasmopsis synoviae]